MHKPREIIAMMGGVMRVSRAIGAPYATVYGWQRRGRFSRKHLLALYYFSLLKARLPLSFNDFLFAEGV